MESRGLLKRYHDEVADALREIGDARLGEAIRVDRGSQLEHLGIRFPALRQRLKQGFSFSHLPRPDQLGIWDELWQSSPYGDVLFAAVESCSPLIRKHPEDPWWPTLRTWLHRVDNWCHCDQLSNAYSYLLESDFDSVYPQLVEWNQSDLLWPRRASLVSLIHYSGKNAVFLDPPVMLPLVENCLSDNRHYVQTAVGWVLREMSRPYESEVVQFLESHSGDVSAKAHTRATERLTPALRTRLRDHR